MTRRERLTLWESLDAGQRLAVAELFYHEPYPYPSAEYGTVYGPILRTDEDSFMAMVTVVLLGDVVGA